MSQDEGYRVATGPHDWVTVKTAEDAVKLGKAFAVLVADLGVYKAERDRLSAENERLRKHRITLIERLDKAIEDINNVAAEAEVLRKKVEWLQKADRLVIWNGTEWQVRHQLDGETRVAK